MPPATDYKGREESCYNAGHRDGKSGEAYSPSGNWNAAEKAAYRDGFDTAREEKGIPR